MRLDMDSVRTVPTRKKWKWDWHLLIAFFFIGTGIGIPIGIAMLVWRAWEETKGQYWEKRPNMGDLYYDTARKEQ